LKLLSISPSLSYLKDIATFLKQEGTSVKYGNVLSDDGSAIRHAPLNDFE
jgi:hypothetical protein